MRQLKKLTHLLKKGKNMKPSDPKLHIFILCILNIFIHSKISAK